MFLDLPRLDAIIGKPVQEIVQGIIILPPTRGEKYENYENSLAVSCE